MSSNGYLKSLAEFQKETEMVRSELLLIVSRIPTAGIFLCFILPAAGSIRILTRSRLPGPSFSSNTNGCCEYKKNGNCPGSRELPVSSYTPDHREPVVHAFLTIVRCVRVLYIEYAYYTNVVFKE